MASLREVARDLIADANGIACLVIWKEGRSWHGIASYDIEYNDVDGWKVADDIREELEEIRAKDRHAICVNPYYENLGEFEEMTIATLMDGIRFQYDLAKGSLDYVLSVIEDDTCEEAEYEETDYAPMNILEYIDHLMFVEGYSEEDAYICADEMFGLRC